jgi:membrane protein YdbS with pleckstrin-like domain
MHWWSFTAGAIAGGLVGTIAVFIWMAESLAPWIRWREQVLQKELAISEELMRRAEKLVEDGHKRSEFRSEL